MANNYLTFCPTDTSTNLLTNSEYSAASDRTSGNQPGVAKSKLVNKALRQASFVISSFAQFLANTTGADIIDQDGAEARLLSQITGVMTPLAPTITRYTSGSGTHNLAYVFQIVSGSATAAATYTNNGITYTVLTTIASGTVLRATGNGAPLASGTLTKTGGGGDATLTFYAVRAPLYLAVELVGGGGGGTGSGTSPGTGGDGTDTTFGTTLLTGAKGAGANNSGTGGAGGTVTVNSPAVSTGSFTGQAGSYGDAVATGTGGNGGATPFGGTGVGAYSGNAGGGAVANTGSGGGGGATQGGGGAGGFVRALIASPAATYAYAVGAAGAAGTAGGGGGFVGGAGAAGIIIVTEHYQ